MRRTTPIIIATALLLASCGGDDDASDEPADEPAAAPADEPADEPAEEPAEATSGGGRGTATLVLDNGESFEFSVLCSLEPQMAAGSEILFTATSYDDPGLDITQFGDEGTITDTASITVYDGDYNTLWSAESFYDVFGGSIELELNGSTISGSATFFSGDDPLADDAEQVEGTVEARC